MGRVDVRGLGLLRQMRMFKGMMRSSMTHLRMMWTMITTCNGYNRHHYDPLDRSGATIRIRQFQVLRSVCQVVNKSVLLLFPVPKLSLLYKKIDWKNIKIKPINHYDISLLTNTTACGQFEKRPENTSYWQGSCNNGHRKDR